METKPAYLTVTTRVKAPLDQVWKFWNEPEHIMQWCHASDDWHAPAATNNPVTGGQFSTTMAARDGSMQFDWAGVYDEVDPMKRIAYTMSDGRTVDIHFSEEAGETRITENFVPENENSLDMQQQGWQAILDHFKQYTEKQVGSNT